MTLSMCVRDSINNGTVVARNDHVDLSWIPDGIKKLEEEVARLKQELQFMKDIHMPHGAGSCPCKTIQPVIY